MSLYLAHSSASLFGKTYRTPMILRPDIDIGAGASKTAAILEAVKPAQLVFIPILFQFVRWFSQENSVYIFLLLEKKGLRKEINIDKKVTINYEFE